MHVCAFSYRRASPWKWKGQPRSQALFPFPVPKLAYKVSRVLFSLLYKRTLLYLPLVSKNYIFERLSGPVISYIYICFEKSR